MAEGGTSRQRRNDRDDSTKEIVTIAFIHHDDTTSRFYAKRKLLCDSSAFYADRFKKAPDTTLVNIWEDQMPFLRVKVFLHWLDEGSTAIDCVLEQQSKRDRKFPHDDDGYLCLRNLWHFGAQYEIPGFQSAVTSAMLVKLEKSKAGGKLILPGPACINWSYHNEGDISEPRLGIRKMQDLLVEMYAKQDSRAHLDKFQDLLSPLFIKDLCKRQSVLLLPNLEGLKINACEFHEHGSDEICNMSGPATKRQREHDVNESCTASESAAKKQRKT